MQGILNRLLLLLSLWCGLSLNTCVHAQWDNLLADEAYFQRQLPEFSLWLQRYHFDRVVQIKQIAVQSNQVVLDLVSNFAHAPFDSLPVAWDALAFEYERMHREPIEHRLLYAFAFHNDLQPYQAKIRIRSRDPRFFDVLIWADHRGNVHVEENARISYMSSGIFSLNQNELREMSSGGRDTLGYQSISTVRRAISSYLFNYYSNKGTPVLYKAKIDTTRTYHNELTYKITNISHEVLDDGFFEYIRINIAVDQKGDQVEIKWNFQGKYGSGIWFAPRESQYKNMEIHYAGQLQRYEQDLIKQITYHLKRRP
ncbi:MAG: hypothetical protein AB8G22_05520 [Saprospiraceae bacterium]